MSNGMISCVQGAHEVEQSHCTHLKYSGAWKVGGLWSVLTQGVSPRLGLTPLVVLWISGLLLAFSSTASATVRVNSTEDNLRLPGQYDSDTHLQHYNIFRDYEPTSGRYIEADPVGLGGGPNPYAYVRGNPLSYVDPLGLFTSTVHFEISVSALEGKGFAPEFFQDAVMSSVSADFLPGSQQVPQAHWHAMSRPRESMQSAAQRMNDFIDAQIARCNAQGLGRALHAIQDSAAAGHRDFHVYNGSVGVGHVLNDANPTAEAFMEALVKSRNLIDRYREQCGCQK